MLVKVKGFYAKEITIFSVGVVSGMAIILLYVWLIRNGLEKYGWFFAATIAGIISTLLGVSRVLRDATTFEKVSPTSKQIEEDQSIHDKARNQTASTNTVESPAPDISSPATMIFPYTTKALEAARNAAIKYWVEYDPENQPLQKNVTSFISEQGIPGRQAQELANAIKPDTLKGSDTTT